MGEGDGVRGKKETVGSCKIETKRKTSKTKIEERIYRDKERGTHIDREMDGQIHEK